MAYKEDVKCKPSVSMAYQISKYFFFLKKNLNKTHKKKLNEEMAVYNNKI